MEQRVNYQEDYSRRRNLRFSGVHEFSEGETWEQTAASVTKILDEKLQLPKVELERAHRVGPMNPSRPRTIVARFVKFGDREAALRNARKLKGSGIYINEDLCAASQAIKNEQLPQLKQARLEGKIAYFKYTKLIVKNRSTQQPSNSSMTSVRGPAASGSDSNGGTSGAERTASAWTSGDSHPSTSTSAVAGAEVSGNTDVGETVAGGKQTVSHNQEQRQLRKEVREKKKK